MIQYTLTEKAKELEAKGIAIRPIRGTPNSAGLDLAACIDEPVNIYPGIITKIPTGIKLFLGEKEWGSDILQIKLAGFYLPRSSNTELVLANTVGTLDCDFQGESFLKVTARENSFTINPGDRIAQLVITLAVMNEPLEVESFTTETIRGEGGDGSTGNNYVHR